jgi:uncharacterized membrane protein/phage FluMu protein Com
MAIEFRCSSCQQLLRVGDDSAGKNAKCPKCGTVVAVPAAGPAPTPSQFAAPFPSAPAFSAPPASPKPAWPGTAPQPGASQSAGNPFAGPPPGGTASGNPFGGGAPPGGPSPNPYAASASIGLPSVPPAYQSGQIVPQRVGVEVIFNYAWQIWKENLGILVVVTLIMIVIKVPIEGGVNFVELMLREDGDEALAAGVSLIGGIFSFLVDVFLWTGQVQIMLKLARRQQAEVGDLFGGGPLYLPALGAAILFNIGVGVGMVLCIVPGIIVALMFWPYFSLIVDRKASVTDSFSLAGKITEGNWGTIFLLALLAVGIYIIGFLALCVGLLFAAPLVSLMWTVAYLMMSGQLSPYPLYQQLPVPQPMPARW